MIKALPSILALCAAALLAMPVIAATDAETKATCEKSAADKKLAGAARDSHIKKCTADAGAAPAAKGSPECEKSADDKKLAGAARNSHVKKCTADQAAKKK